MAFSTTCGHYKHTVMLYWLSRTPSVFQCLINAMLRDMLGKFIIIYINNILIYSPSLASHVDHIKEVLSCLQEIQLHVKGEKCKFHTPNISFLGYIISNEGLIMDNTKVRAMIRWPTPCKVKDLR